ncbi:hypothetical protein D3C80_1967040 [compost metagenome]
MVQFNPNRIKLSHPATGDRHGLHLVAETCGERGQLGLVILQCVAAHGCKIEKYTQLEALLRVAQR